MNCATCGRPMERCQMAPMHWMCLFCSDDIAAKAQICRAHLDEYNATVAYIALLQATQPARAAQLVWCQVCNDFMRMPHTQHQPRKSWIAKEEE